MIVHTHVEEGEAVDRDHPPEGVTTLIRDVLPEGVALLHVTRHSMLTLKKI